MSAAQVWDTELAWVADNDPAASAVLAHHHPDVPNLGDITAADWATVPPVDVVTAGFPCQDISYAGRGAGIREGNRSGLWHHIADAVGVLRPRYIVLENVAAIVVRRPGLDVVLADLARLGFDAVWTCVRASDVGAPHHRNRWIGLAWAADAEGPRLQGQGMGGRAAGGDRADADSDRLGGERNRATGQPPQRHPAGAGDAAADPSSEQRRTQPLPERRSGGTAIAGPHRQPPTNAESNGWDEGRPESAGLVRGSDAALSGAPSSDAHCDARRAERDGEPLGRQAYDEQRELDAGGRLVDWGRYRPAIRRWERITGRKVPAPRLPTGRNGSDQLSPAFVEWLMGLPGGHVTAVDGLTRNQRLRLLGNGVVPGQAAHALRLLLPEMRGAA
jgi:DNA (cytosine-5)-methyltransferase 1